MLVMDRVLCFRASVVYPLITAVDLLIIITTFFYLLVLQWCLKSVDAFLIHRKCSDLVYVYQHM